MDKVRVAIVGAAGYAGEELLRLLSRHPYADIRVITSRQNAGKDIAEIFPRLAGTGLSFSMPDPEAILSRLGVGERQLVRYADEVLQREYDVSALPQLLLIWTAYRQLRGTRTDPLRCVGGGAAALAYNYMLIYGPKPGVDELAKAFGCDARQLVYYARRITGRLERIGDDTREDT